ncbi:hypothetical protein [Selenomonas ruminantium]|nr:hypothetical protein [Selenomonas ruminantium]
MSLHEILLGYVVFILLCLVWVTFSLAKDYQRKNHYLLLELRRLKSHG